MDRRQGVPGEHDKYRALYTLGSTMSFNTLIEAERLANLALSMLVEFTRASAGHLVLFDEAGEIRHHFGLTGGTAPSAAELEPAVARRLGSLARGGGGAASPGEDELEVALRAEEALVGALILNREAGAGPFPPGDRALVEACASHLAQSLRSRQLYEAHLAQRRRAELVERVTRAVHGPADLEETLGVIIRSAAEALGAGGGAVILGDSGGRLGVAAAWRRGAELLDPRVRPGDHRLIHWVFSEGTPFCDGDRILAPVVQVLRDRRVFQERRRAVQGEPFTRTLGVIYMEKEGREAEFVDEDLMALRVFSDHAAAAITNNALIRQASTDPLTGLESRLHLEPRLGEEIQFARRHGAPVSLIMADIDHFKQINDLHGHQSGDEVLCQVARILREAVRQNDLCARYGGEEFTVVLPETHLAGAQVVAENIRRRVEAALFSRERIPVTVSLGVAELPLHANTADSLLRQADRALYQAKEAGRNCCRTASSG